MKGVCFLLWGEPGRGEGGSRGDRGAPLGDCRAVLWWWCDPRCEGRCCAGGAVVAVWSAVWGRSSRGGVVRGVKAGISMVAAVAQAGIVARFERWGHGGHCSDWIAERQVLRLAAAFMVAPMADATIGKARSG
jgi:hypothetical protein